MRRFCNYFLTLYNQKKLNPFTQFVNTVTLKKVKQNVRLKMQYFTKGIYVDEDKAHVHSGKKKIKGEDKKKKGGKAQKVPISDMTNKNKFGGDPSKINSSSDLAPRQQPSQISAPSAYASGDEEDGKKDGHLQSNLSSAASKKSVIY